MKFVTAVMVISIFIILTQYVNALKLEYYGIEDTINNDLSVVSIVTLKFSEPITHLEYELTFPAENLSVESKFTSNCEMKTERRRSIIYCDFMGMSKENNMLKLRFLINNAVYRMNNNYLFKINYGISLPIDRVFTLIKLPENGALAKQPANQSYFPSNGNIMTDGKHIMIYWQEGNLTSGSNLQFSVLFSFPSAFFISSDNLLIAILTVFVIISMLGIAIYMKSGKKIETVTSVLNKDERAVVDVLKKNKGKTLQKNIVRETGFSKAKVSRLVKNLKERGIVDIEPVSGRENRIILKT